MNPRQPLADDLVLLAQALTAFGVEYALVGGTAMAVHGFSLATKDIDLLLPVSADNNARLLKALASIPGNTQALSALRRERMDKGHSTALEGEIYVDLLYVAADQTFESLKAHIQTVIFEGASVVTLDVDGMLLTKQTKQTKQTKRETDVPDRLKPERLRSALRVQAAVAEPKPE